ncbi:MAG: DUF1549 domain-containing protein, partial [Planctomycetaceae bacterium]|nr:DUF1549 domain-containing protein [Planctomycetaceae bacterium]
MRSLPLAVCLAVLLMPALVTRADDIDFNRDIRPILSNRCFACHGPDESNLEAGLRLDDGEVAVSVLSSGGRAIVPGKPDESQLIERITSSDPDLRMPPADFGKPLSEKEVATLRNWIAAGAPFATHWSYQPIRRPDLPALAPDQQAWVTNPIDQFVVARAASHGLSPMPEAAPLALIRRLYLDLTGLP